MADIDFAPDLEEIVWGEPSAVLDVGAASTDDGVWEAFAVERDGTVVAALERINLKRISERINAVPTLTFEVPLANPDSGEVDLVAREIAVYRSGGNPIFVGPILQRGADSGSGAADYSAAGVGWYLTRRLRGGYVPWSRNYIVNPRFDDGFDRWLLSGTGISLDAESETGTDSAELADSMGASIRQSFMVDIAVKFQLVVEARIKLGASATTGRGLEVSVPGVQGGDQFRSVPVTEATPNGAWTTLLGVLQVEGRVGSRTVTVEVFDVDGDVVKVDHVSATIFPITSLPESSPAPVPQVDQAQVIRETIMAVNRGLHLGVSCPDTGQLVDYEPDGDVDRYADEIVRRYSDREHGVDWSIEATPFTRTFTTHYPRMGRDITPEEVTLRVVAEGLEPRNLSGYRLAEDASKAVSEVTTVGDGDYRGVYQDPEAWGGLLLQSTQKAPEGTPLADLEGLSRKALRSSLDDVTALTVTVSDGELIGTVRLGDRVLVVIDHLAVQVSAVFRVVARDIDVPTDSMQLTLNVEPV